MLENTQKNEEYIKAKLELEALDHTYELASKSKRFAHLLIDTIMRYILTFIIVILLAFIAPSWVQKIEESKVFDYLLAYVITFLYTLIFEYYTGKTLGKIITKTTVITHHYEKPTFSDILLRSLYRLIPFDGLSFIGTESEGWHDKWSETIVVNDL